MSTPSKSRKSTKSASKSVLPTQHKTDDSDLPAKTFILPTDKHLLELTSGEEYKSIIKEVLDRVIVVEFFAHWCGPCKILTTKLNEIAEKYKEKLLIVKIDVDEFEELTVDNNVSAIPTFMIMKNTRVVEKFSNSNVELLEEMLVKIVGKPEEVESSAAAEMEGNANR